MGEENKSRLDYNLMKAHERYFIVEEAAGELSKFVHELQAKHKLTDLETLKVVRELEERWVGNYFKFQLRYERHGCYDKKADEE